MFSTLLPPEGAKTLWEDRCILFHLDNAQNVSDSPKLLPSVVLAGEVAPDLTPQRAATYPPDGSGGEGSGEEGRGSLAERLGSHLRAAVSPLGLGAPLAAFWSRFLSGCQPRPAAPPLDWHPRRPWLAAADPRGRVHVLQLGPGGGGGGGEVMLLAGGSPGQQGGGGGCVKVVLGHEALGSEQALSLAWSPTSPGLLAVGGSGAVGLWALAGAAEAKPPLAAAGRAAGPWLRLLRTRVQGARVTSLSWSPDGRMLAAASPNQAGLQVWEVASGTPTSVGAGPAAFDTVRWSPCGSYVFAAGTGSRYFYIFETQRWRWARWQTTSSTSSGSPSSPAAPPTPAPSSSSAPSSASSSFSSSAAAAALPRDSVVAAAWAPPAPGRPPLLLAALSGLPYLVAVHLVEAAPGLTAQLLPVGLPELQRGAARSEASGDLPTSGPSSSSASSAAPCIVDMSWEPRGERLAVLLAPAPGRPPHCLALYGTTSDPLVSARLLGFARPPQRLCEAAGAPAGGDGAAGAAEGEGGEGGSGEAAGPSTADAAAAAAGASAAPPPAPAALVALPGSLAAARWLPGGAASSAGGGGPSPSVVISARVGQWGVYNLPCYF